MMTDYAIGWEKRIRGKSLNTCANDEQRRGWHAANRAQATAEAILQPTCTAQIEPDGDMLWA